MQMVRYYILKKKKKKKFYVVVFSVILHLNYGFYFSRELYAQLVIHYYFCWGDHSKIATFVGFVLLSLLPMWGLGRQGDKATSTARPSGVHSSCVSAFGTP